MWNTLKRLTNWLDEILNPGNDKALLEFARVALDEALAQLAQAEIDLADKAFYVREFAAVSHERDKLKAEIAALRERASVPEVKALREIGINAYLMHEQAKRENAGCIVGPMEAAATAIRNAVLAGVAAEKPIDPPADQVEALARVLCKANGSEYAVITGEDGYSIVARAALEGE